MSDPFEELYASVFDRLTMHDLVRKAAKKAENESTQRRIDGMSSILIKQMKNMDLSDVPTFKKIRLLPLGAPFHTASVGNVKCGRFAYFGEDGKFYIEGPRERSHKAVVDIHPYGKQDKGWFGVARSELADLMATYFI